jgi:hypothetical protein
MPSHDKKLGSVRKAITDEAWVRQLDILAGLNIQQLQEFTSLWSYTSCLTLHNDILDTIIWKLTTNGIYTCSSAYNGQFEGNIRSSMDYVVWKIWAVADRPISTSPGVVSSSTVDFSGVPFLGYLPLLNDVVNSFSNKFN